MSPKPLHSFAGQPGHAMASGLLTLGFLFLVGIAFLFAAKNIAGILTGCVFVTGSVLLTVYSRSIQLVDFFEKTAVVHYFGYRKPVEIPYANIKSVRPATLRYGERIFVVEMKNREPIRRFTWHCSDAEFSAMKPLLRGYGIRIVRE